MFKKYLDYTEDDFINDPNFQEWIIDPNSENGHSWEAFFQENPHKKQAAEGARDFLKNISFKEDFPEENLIERVLRDNDVPYISTKEIVRQHLREHNGTIDDYYIKGDGHRPCLSWPYNHTNSRNGCHRSESRRGNHHYRQP